LVGAGYRLEEILDCSIDRLRDLYECATARSDRDFRRLELIVMSAVNIATATARNVPGAVAEFNRREKAIVEILNRGKPKVNKGAQASRIATLNKKLLQMGARQL
jgi:hypothetical protein